MVMIHKKNQNVGREKANNTESRRAMLLKLAIHIKEIKLFNKIEQLYYNLI